LQQPLTAEQIAAIAARAFPVDEVLSAHELAGGENSTIYRLCLAGGGRAILRVAPAAITHLLWRNPRPLRLGYVMQPYFAHLGTLLPRTLFADFTRLALDRDYLLQEDMPGENWFAVAKPLSQAEEQELMRQLARITRSIADVTGTYFGRPLPHLRFPTWSAAVLDSLERVLDAARGHELDVRHTAELLDLARARTDPLDEIATPRLMHGDLWAFNTLIERRAHGPEIVAVLDYDDASWGDPLADWTFHLLPRRASAAAQAAFWSVYGPRETTPAARFRELIYDGMHASVALVYGVHRGRDDIIPIAQQIVQDALEQLRNLRV
jgi:hypothetical protein